MKWFEYKFIDQDGIETNVVLEAYSDGTSSWFNLDGSDFVVPVPGTNVVLSEIPAPSWAHNDKLPVLPPPPSRVTPRQIRIALTQMGLRQQVEDIVQSSDQDTKDSWEYAIEIDRYHPLCLQLATSSSMTEDQLDELFRVAGGIQ